MAAIPVMLSGCSNPDDVMFGPNNMSDQIECDGIKKLLSPDKTETDYFLNRIDGGVVVRPINVSCINNMYDQKELASWASVGDPVAIYTVVYNQSNGRKFCSDYKDKMRTLNGSLDKRVTINNGFGSSVISRVPEAALAMASLNIRCAGGDGAHYIDLAAKSGYDVHHGIEE